VKDQVFDIGPDGTVTTLYDDSQVELGELKVTRASEVEFAPDGSGWYVKLSCSPLNREHAGKMIGTGFKTRQEALDYEVAFLNKYVLGV
jgi:hypothetical protein